jgi:hypothetical protein
VADWRNLLVTEYASPAIVTTSLISRVSRSTELRVTEVQMGETTRHFIEEAASGEIRIIANEPNERDQREYVEKGTRGTRAPPHPRQRPGALPGGNRARPIGVRVGAADHRRATVRLPHPAGGELGGANSIAALLLCIRDQTGKLPQVYFSWTEGSPIVNVLRYLVFGDGEVAPVTREVSRHAEPDPGRRPTVHVA